jgi:hypothetical protein
MKNTLQLLEKAVSKKKPAEWARLYNITQATITNARKSGHLSPALTGNLAIDLGEDAREWIAIAVMETEREGPLKDRLIEKMGVRNS